SGITVAACSLHVAGTGWSYATVSVREWDPVSLAPDPTTLALRTQYEDPSTMSFYTLNSIPTMKLRPPVVTRSVADVAEPPRGTVAIAVGTYAATYFTYPFNGYFDGAGNASMPPGVVLDANGAPSALPGDHPVFAHAICNGDADLDQLR